MLDLDKWDKIPGWFNKAEGQALYDVVYVLPEKSHIIEIGCFRGKSTIAMLQACADSSPSRRKFVSSMDNFSGTGEDFGSSTEESKRIGAALVKEEIRNWGLGGWFGKLWPITSEEWFGRKPIGSYWQMFFIDGCHVTVADDMLKAWERLHHGGVLVCHDYDPANLGHEIVKAIDGCKLPGSHCGIQGTSLWKAIKT